MSKSPKQVVKDFHQANIINDETLLENYFHENFPPGPGIGNRGRIASIQIESLSRQPVIAPHPAIK